MIDTLFLTMFVGLFAVTAPIADLPLFVAATDGQAAPERRRTALIAGTTYVVVGLVALFAGNSALAFFGVSVATLRLAGMAVVAAIGWQMVNAPTIAAGPARTAHLHAASNTRIAAAEPVKLSPPSAAGIGITPLGFPIYAGPGVLSVIIAWGSGPERVYVGATLAIFANAALIVALNFLATPITRIIGEQGLLVTEKLFGLIVVAIAVGGMASALLVLFPGLGRV